MYGLAVVTYQNRVKRLIRHIIVPLYICLDIVCDYMHVDKHNRYDNCIVTNIIVDNAVAINFQKFKLAAWILWKKIVPEKVPSNLLHRRK